MRLQGDRCGEQTVNVTAALLGRDGHGPGTPGGKVGTMLIIG